MKVTDGPYGSKSFFPQFLRQALARTEGIQRAFLIPENKSSQQENDQHFVECFLDLRGYAPFGSGDFVFIDRSAEAGAIRPRLELLNELADSIGLDRPNLIYVSQNPKVALASGVSGPSWLWFHHYLIAMSRTHRSNLDDYGFRESGSRILCLNNKRRGHRIAIAKAAHARFGDQLLMSWMATPWQRADEDFQANFPQTFSRDLPEPDAYELTPTVGGSGALAFSEAAVRDTFFQLVTETEVSHHSQRFTEKILKPIACHRPFVVFGPMGTLARLRDLGFRTFSDIFPEDYDDIADPEQRMCRILDVIDDIVQSDRSKFLERVASACSHNQRHLSSQVEGIVLSSMVRDLRYICSFSRLQVCLDTEKEANAELSRKIAESSAESELLIAQLHQVQEELEHYFLDNERLFHENACKNEKLSWLRAQQRARVQLSRLAARVNSRFLALAGRISVSSASH